MSTAARPRPDRLAALQTALIAGVHADQQRLAAKDAAKYPAFAGDGAAGAATWRALMKLGAPRIAAWVAGGTDAEVERAVVQLAARPAPASPQLPVNALIAELKRRGARDERGIAAVANLLQLNLQENEDGDLLQDLFRLYHALGQPLNLAQLGVAHDDAAMADLARACAGTSHAGPFPANDAAYWILSFTRIAMWGDKNSGRRDVAVLARELAAEPAIAALKPALAALPPRRIAFIGYSMLMSVNWSTHGSWNDVAATVAEGWNPGWSHRGFQRGGIRAQHARRDLLPDALAWKPQEAVLLMYVVDQHDADELAAIARELAATGCRVRIVDDVRPWLDSPDDRTERARKVAAAERAGVESLQLWRRGFADPAWRAWECLDKIHMTTPGHVFYARELLRRWASERG